MTLRPPPEHCPPPSAHQRRIAALEAAIALRNGSFRSQNTYAERQVCRALMRVQALRWRDLERAQDEF